MISAADVFRVFQTHRGNAIVIATGTSGRHWRDFTTNEKRDLTMGGAMGQTTAAALGRPCQVGGRNAATECLRRCPTT